MFSSRGQKKNIKNKKSEKGETREERNAHDKLEGI